MKKYLAALLLIAVGGAYIFSLLKNEVSPPPLDTMSCISDSDCACGRNKQTNDCAFGNANYIDTQNQCPDFCSGFDGNLVIKCISNVCTQVSSE